MDVNCQIFTLVISAWTLNVLSCSAAVPSSILTPLTIWRALKYFNVCNNCHFWYCLDCAGFYACYDVCDSILTFCASFEKCWFCNMTFFSPFGLLNIYRLETLLYLYMLRIKMVCFMTCVGNVSLRKSLFSVSHLKLCIYKEAGNYRPINIYKSSRCSLRVILFLTTVTSWRLSLGMQNPAQPMTPCKAVPQSSPASLYSAHMFYLCP